MSDTTIYLLYVYNSYNEVSVTLLLAYIVPSIMIFILIQNMFVSYNGFLVEQFTLRKSYSKVDGFCNMQRVFVHIKP